MIRPALATLILCLANATAVGDVATANTLADQATELAGKGLFKEAAGKFAEAYRADPSRPTLFCNVGISFYKAEQWARAHLLLKLCLDRTALDQAFIDSARPVIAAIEDTLRAGGHAPVKVQVDPKNTSVSVAEWGPEETFIGERLVWLPLGTFHLVGKLDGYVDQTLIVKTETTAQQDVTILLNKPVDIKQPPAIPSSQARSKLPAIVAGGATVVSLALAALYLHKGSGIAARSEFALDQSTLADDRDDLKSANRIVIIAGALTVIGAGVTTFLWLRTRHPAHTRVEVSPTTGGAAATLTRAF